MEEAPKPPLELDRGKSQCGAGATLCLDVVRCAKSASLPVGPLGAALTEAAGGGLTARENQAYRMHCLVQVKRFHLERGRYRTESTALQDGRGNGWFHVSAQTVYEMPP